MALGRVDVRKRGHDLQFPSFERHGVSSDAFSTSGTKRHKRLGALLKTPEKRMQPEWDVHSKGPKKHEANRRLHAVVSGWPQVGNEASEG